MTPKFRYMITSVSRFGTRNTLRIAHLRIGYLVGNPEVGNPDPYQSSGLPTSIITLFFTLSAGFTVLAINSGCFGMLFMYLIYSS